MIDFSIDNSGDLILERKNYIPKLNILFRKSSFPIFNLKFLQTVKTMDTTNNNNYDFCINFKTYNNKDDGYDVVNRTVIDKEELKQRIRILLRTEQNELLNKEDFGSRIYTYKHLDILADSTITGIKQTVLNELSNIIDTESNTVDVEVIPKISNGPFYCQNINIYIYLNNELLYDFVL